MLQVFEYYSYASYTKKGGGRTAGFDAVANQIFPLGFSVSIGFSGVYSIGYCPWIGISNWEVFQLILAKDSRRTGPDTNRKFQYAHNRIFTEYRNFWLSSTGFSQLVGISNFGFLEQNSPKDSRSAGPDTDRKFPMCTTGHLLHIGISDYVQPDILS